MSISFRRGRLPKRAGAVAEYARALQDEVWREVAEKSDRHGVRSHTGAMHDVFEDLGDRAHVRSVLTDATRGPEFGRESRSTSLPPLEMTSLVSHVHVV